MTGEQMEKNFGITDYSFINASPNDAKDSQSVSNQLLQVIRNVPKAVLQDYTSAIETQNDYLKQQQIFFSGIAVILLVISLFHIVNSMNHEPDVFLSDQTTEDTGFADAGSMDF